jgi:hypothetical protein
MGVLMDDPFSAAAVGGVLFTESIKFLYQQAGEVLTKEFKSILTLIL